MTRRSLKGPCGVLLTAWAICCWSGGASAQSATDAASAPPVAASIVEAFAPSGKLRASINLGNPILASRESSGRPVGVSVDLADALAVRLGVPVELVVFDGAGKSVDAVADERADIGFFAIDPLRGTSIAFTDPYVLIEGSYLVRSDSPIRSNDEVDREGRRVVVGKGQRLRSLSDTGVQERAPGPGADVAARDRHVRRRERRRRRRRQAAARGGCASRARLAGCSTDASW